MLDVSTKGEPRARLAAILLVITSACGDDGGAGGAATSTTTTTSTSNATSTSTTTSTTTATSTTGGGAFSFYGVPWSADALQNWNIGSDKAQRWSYRFRAPSSGAIAALRVFFVTNPSDLSKTGYADGNGGTVRVEIRPDDGSALHAPTDEVLGAVEKGGFGLTQGAPPDGFDPGEVYFPLLTFDAPIAVDAGALYHAVFTNVDPDPATNWIGLDGLIEFDSESPAPVRPSFVDWGLLLGSTEDDGWVDWTTNGDDVAIDTPVMSIVYGDGTVFGCGYMEVWPSDTQARAIDATRAVRQTFVASRDVTATSVGVRVRGTGSGGALVVRLEQDDGAVIEEARVDASAIPGDAQTWVSAPFTEPRQLIAGNGYNLVLGAEGGGSFRANCVRDGGSYGFEAQTVFADGHAEFDAGDGQGFLGWYGWSPEGNASYTDGDLQFYLAE